MPARRTCATGTERILIARSSDVVRAQFFDVKHHCDNAVHSGPRWQLVSDIGGRKTVRIGRQLGEIYWDGDTLWLAIIKGPGAGGTIAHRFVEAGSDTEVIATYTIPLPRLLGALAPIARWLVSRQLRKGLLEDSVDLETYQPQV